MAITINKLANGRVEITDTALAGPVSIEPTAKISKTSTQIIIKELNGDVKSILYDDIANIQIEGVNQTINNITEAYNILRDSFFF